MQPWTSRTSAPRGRWVPLTAISCSTFVLHQQIGALLDDALTGTGVRPAEYAVYSQLGIDAMTPRELTARPACWTGSAEAESGRLVQPVDRLAGAQ